MSDDDEDFGSRTFRSPNVSVGTNDQSPPNPAHRRRWGRAGTNLKGSCTGTPEIPQRTAEGHGMANITIQTEIKLVVKTIPDDPIEYPGWRFSLKSKILGLHMPTSFLFDFIKTIEDQDLTALIDPESRELYLALDAKLFLVLVRLFLEKRT